MMIVNTIVAGATGFLTLMVMAEKGYRGWALLVMIVVFLLVSVALELATISRIMEDRKVYKRGK